MNPESQFPQPSPASACGLPPQSIQESGCGVSPQTVPGASRSDLHPPLITAHCFASGHVRCAPILGTSSPHPYDDMVYPPETFAEPDYDGDFDFEDAARERELMLDDLADYNDDFSRSEPFF